MDYNEKLLETMNKLHEMRDSLNVIIKEIQEYEDECWKEYTIEEVSQYLYVSEESILKRYEPYLSDGELVILLHDDTLNESQICY